MTGFIVGFLFGLFSFIFLIYFYAIEIWRPIKQSIKHLFKRRKTVFLFDTPFDCVWVKSDIASYIDSSLKLFFKDSKLAYYGRIKEGVTKNGLWNYTEFEIMGINSTNSVILTVGEDLLKIYQQITIIVDTLQQYEIKVLWGSNIKDLMNDIEKKVSNMQVLKRHEEKQK